MLFGEMDRFCWCLLILSLVSCSLIDEQNATDSEAIASPAEVFGRAFLSNAGLSPSRGPLTMVLPDSPSDHSRRHRRHVVCGRTKKKPRTAMNFEQRLICPFKKILNHNVNRIPQTLEEVRCICERPSHLSTYSEVRCQPLKFRIPVVFNVSGILEPGHEELTLSCIPAVPSREDDGAEFLHQLS